MRLTNLVYIKSLLKVLLHSPRITTLTHSQPHRLPDLIANPQSGQVGLRQAQGVRSATPTCAPGVHVARALFTDALWMPYDINAPISGQPRTAAL